MQLERIFGGSPLAVVAKLLFISLVIGAIMTGFGLTPMGLFHRALASVRSVMALGFGAFRDVVQYVLTGAVVVIPIWHPAHHRPGALSRARPGALTSAA